MDGSDHEDAPVRRRKGFRKVVVKFDPDARREYLLGFRKRKMERRKRAEEILKERQRQERLQARADVRACGMWWAFPMGRS